MKTKQWQIPVSIVTTATALVYADTLDEALDKLNEMNYDDFINQDTELEVYDDEAVGVDVV